MKQLLAAIAILLVFCRSAFAYLDPGTGSIILQGILAGLLTIGVFWRNLKNGIKKLFNRKNNVEDS